MTSNGDVHRLRVEIHATAHSDAQGAVEWSGIAKLRAECRSGAVQDYVIATGTRHPTRAAAIDAARAAFVRDVMAAHRVAARPPPSDTVSPWSECYM